MSHPTDEMIRELAQHAGTEVNERIGAPRWQDQSAGNQCHNLTLLVMQALEYRGVETARELHRDSHGNWHYLLRHTAVDKAPTNEDLITDLNPWQWIGDFSKGKGPLHAPRSEVMQTLEESGAPDYFIALRSLTTVAKLHEPRLNFGGRIDASLASLRHSA